MSAIIENGKKAVIKTLEESAHDNIFLNMGVGCGHYMFGRKKDGVITTQLIEYSEEETISEFSKDCRHISETKDAAPPQATESEARMKRLEKRIAILEDILLKKGIDVRGGEDS
jgi:hypothetical protein